MFMLDTDSCSFVLKQKPIEVIRHFDTLEVGELCLSAITQAELLYGVERKQSKKLQLLVNRFISRMTVLSWPAEATLIYARRRHQLDQAGIPIGNMDLLIAAHAMAVRATLVTNNVKHFARVEGLLFENWAER